jgi:hypothetical protein
MITVTDKIAAPSLPLAPEDWNRRYQDQFSNVLRLYFNQLNTSVNNQTANTTTLQTEIDALSVAVEAVEAEIAALSAVVALTTQRNQTLIWLGM